MENTEFKERTNLEELRTRTSEITDAVGKVVLGQEKVIRQIIIGILSDGHILLEGVPGIAKTLLVKLFAKSIEADYSRIQFTPDLMPSDVIGTSIFNSADNRFEFRKGPVFGNIVLVDEINRSPAKTQAALFEVMEERQITYDGEVYNPGNPFMVFATQNPIEHEGTYRLPEAQLDRFLFKINIDYPTLDSETEILKNSHARKGSSETDEISPVLTKEEINNYRLQIKSLHIDEKLMSYIAQITDSTRHHASLYLGASPRASLAIMNASKATAAVNGRDFVTPDDIKEVCYPVLRHRIILSPEKEMEGMTTADVIKQILTKIEIPR
ncbi:MAG: MoxR family ATPase [Bacteroidota bacterium]|nr:MoxR family ATPase [Bacteroidota bacterium]